MTEDFQRIKRLPPYVFNIVGELKAEARRKGEDIIDFGMGNPDQDTPKHIVDKLIEVVQREGTHKYSVSQGIPRLRKAICNWYKNKFNVELDYKTEAVVTIGSKEGLAHLAMATVDKGDTVLVPNPAYPIHPYGFIIAGADIRHVKMTPDVDFFAELEKSIKESWPKPKMLVMNFPGNPTTQTVELEFFEKVIAIAKEHNIWVIHDLAYADIVFDGYKAPSILEVEGAKDIAVEFYTLSKSYNMPGWRVGFMVGNPTLVDALKRMKSYLDYGTFTPIQVAAIEALEGPQECVQEISDMYKLRRNVLCNGLNSIGWDVILPKATMFVWAKIPSFYQEMGSLEFSKKLLVDAKVAVSPGVGFGDYGDDHVRFGLIENEHRTRQAIRGIRDMFKKDGLGNKVIIVKKIRLGLLGLGTVGSGTVKIINETLPEIERRLGGNSTIVVEHIALRDLTKKRPVNIDNIKITTNPLDVVNDPNVDIVVELMGGTTLAKECFEIAIANKKHIVTANKALIAEYGNELFTKAQANNVVIAYEAAVAGGIPIIKALREGLAANKMQWVAGIINGTGNYILTEMKKPNANFNKVLKTAQDLGYAEADPTFDVEGIDAAHKLAIIASITFGIKLEFNKVYTEGISKITAEDINFAQRLGYQIKHLGIANSIKNGYSLRVHPTLIPNSILISNVDGVMNAVMAKGDNVGTTMYYGAGAGAGATASAVMADVIDIIRGLNQPQQDKVPGLGFALNKLKQSVIIDITEIECRYYLRFFAKNQTGVLAKITKVMASFDISIEELHQEPCTTNNEDATLIILTNSIKELVLNKLLKKLSSYTEIDDEIQRIRIADLS